MPNHALIVITGHIGKVEEIKFLTNGGTPVLRFSLCVNTGFGDKKTASWYDCSYFGDRATKVAQFLGKGKPITVVGEPSIRKWEKDGKAGTAVSVRVSEIVFLGSRDDHAAADDQSRETQAEQQIGPDDSIPF